MKKGSIFMYLALAFAIAIKCGWLYSVSERNYSEIRSDYLNKGNIDEKFGFITGLNKIDFFTFFTHPSFVDDVLLPIGNCAGNREADSERCQALLVAIIRKTGEQALKYYGQYAKLMGLINRPYQMVRVLQDMYAYDPKKIAQALYQLVIANPGIALIDFKGDVPDFGLTQYVLLKYVTAVLKNPVDQGWLPLLQVAFESWKKNADNATRLKVIDFSAPSIMALATADDFEVARAKAVNPLPLLTTEGLVNALGIKI